MNPGFELEIKDKIADIKLNRPEKKNALAPEFWKRFPECVAELADKGTIRAIILSAAGADFCSGMDLSVFAGNDKLSTDSAYERERLYHLVKHIQAAVSAIENSRIPVIAAIQGRCLGAGLDLVSACDLRYATEDAVFRIEETNIGIMADLGSLQRLPGILPTAIVKEMAFTGSSLKADRALETGFLNGVAKDMDSLNKSVLKVAESIAEKPPLVVSGSKLSINYAREHSIEDSLDNAALRQSQIFDSKEIMQFIQCKKSNQPHPTDLKETSREL